MESPTYIVIILIQEKEISIKRSTETAKRKGKTSCKQWLTEFGLIITKQRLNDTHLIPLWETFTSLSTFYTKNCGGVC